MDVLNHSKLAEPIADAQVGAARAVCGEYSLWPFRQAQSVSLRGHHDLRG